VEAPDFGVEGGTLAISAVRGDSLMELVRHLGRMVENVNNQSSQMK